LDGDQAAGIEMALFHDGKWEMGFYEVVDYKFGVNQH